MGLSKKIEELKVVTDDNKVEGERQRQAQKHADGWEKGIQFDGTNGFVNSGLVEASPADGDWSQIMEEFGLDPSVYMIHPDSVVQVRAWDANLGKDSDGNHLGIHRMRYYRAPICLRNRWTFISEEELRKIGGKFKPPSKKILTADYAEAHAFVVNLADWQLGKGGEGNDVSGVESTVERINDSIGGAKLRLAELRKTGINVETIVIAGLGDLIERCSQNYSTQAYSTELNERQQFRLGVRLFVKAVKELSPLAPKVIVFSVGGNHGETRNNGKMFTDTGDNFDTAMVDMASMALEGHDNVRFVPLENKLWVTLDLYGVAVGWTHGHLARGGANASAKQYKWWQQQAVNKTDIGDVEVLVTGHYHSLNVTEHSQGALHLQCPAMDSGSEWWQNATGERSTPGTLTFIVGPSTRMKADKIQGV